MTNVRVRPLSGLDLMYQRRLAGLRQEDLGRLMGVSRSRVAHLEGEYRPAEGAVRRYLDALQRMAEQARP